MAKKAQVMVTTSFNLGDRVRIKDLAGQVGRIEELRGPLGPGGASVYRVKVRKKPRASYIELLGNQLEFLPVTNQGAAAQPRRTAPKASRAKKGG
ncbi:hypothetical protein [Paludisphaera sp.]|uniref:hypothetical protein n=1 Tax=Paludisphaera sp. TaxID=2017432 RepID=UPI00301C5B9E